ncbi:hypothetical protein ACJZ2D_011461 [Fusarium nematophilum]
MPLSTISSFGISFLTVATAAAAIVALATRFLWPACSAQRSTRRLGRNATTTARALPSAWYRSEEIYELERRAIFSKKWILVTHILRLPERGSWVRYEEAGFQFFLVKNNEGKINGFHNICRHRAFPVVTKEQGQSSVLSCKYHGWSYGLNGQLTKAPGYLDMQDFDKSKNGLFPIHVHVDSKGFIWVNLDASKNPEAWSEEFNAIDRMSRHEPFNFEDYHFDHTWEMSGEGGPDHRQQLLFPQRMHDCVAPFLLYDENASDEDFKRIDEMFKRILGEDKWLCNHAQKNLNAGVFINGEMHPRMEEGPLYFQSRIRELLTRHHKLEEATRREIRPAEQILSKGVEETEQDIGFCSGLACGKDAVALAW